ncbi:MAG: cobalamin-dependent protein [Gammaproteobacteria bacterium]|nr:cobalamin-dependent protein [Gammaproteobacteria bacterium]
MTDINDGPAVNGGRHPPAGDRRPRVLLTKIGLDGHDRGSRIVATWLRDAGMEVIYTGPWQAIADVVTLATDEDVDLIGISSLATDHRLVPRLMQALADAGLGEVPVVVGGIVPPEDEQELLRGGVARVFHPGASRTAVVDDVTALLRDAAASGPGHDPLSAA